MYYVIDTAGRFYMGFDGDRNPFRTYVHYDAKCFNTLRQAHEIAARYKGATVEFI